MRQGRDLPKCDLVVSPCEMGAVNILVVFAKEPVPGKVKTRLAETLGADAAAEIYLAFLADLRDRFRTTADNRYVAYTPGAARTFFAQFFGDDYRLVPQGDGDLGERMARVFETHLRGEHVGREGTGVRVVVVGSDSPTLPLGRVRDAFALLAENDVVLGPACDGGYYLVGCRRPAERLFDDIDWGKSLVLLETVQRLSGGSMRLALLDPWYDVDTIEDWQMLQGHASALRRAGLNPGIPHTEQKWR